MSSAARTTSRYSPQEVRHAYDVWAELTPELVAARQNAWDHYVDLRDNRAEGTTARARLEGAALESRSNNYNDRDNEMEETA